MFNPKTDITNPEAIKLINDIQSGAIFVPIKNKIIRYKWFIVGGVIVIALLIALAIGKSLSENPENPVFLPPDTQDPFVTPTVTVKSSYESVRQEILDFSTDLPDPVVPPFDNNMDLEPTVF